MSPSRSSSTSSISSASSSPPEDTHHIFVKLLSGETIPLTIPSSTPLPHLQHLLSLRTSAPASSIRLVHAGRHLTAPPTSITPSSPTTTTNTTASPNLQITPPPTLSSLLLPQNATLHITLPILGGMPPKKIKCTFKDCKAASQRIVGDCSFCQGHFCGVHRMLEDHKCTGLEDCKAEAYERNREVLEGGKTLAVRGI